MTATCHEILQAATAVDDPLGPVMSLRHMAAKLEHNPDPSEAWYVPGRDPGSALAWYWLHMPDLENTDRAYLSIAVDPDLRRQGIGTELLRHASERAVLHGKRVLSAPLLIGTAAAAFALEAGAVPGVVGQRRVLHLDKVPDEKLAELGERARQTAPEYSLLTWTGPTPDGHRAAVARLYGAHEADARQYEEGVAPQRWDSGRVHERHDRKFAAWGLLVYSVAAFHTATGEMVALTQVTVDHDTPEWAEQQTTTVLAPHRGRRLGIQVKAALAWWLKQAEPRVRHVVTWSVESSYHMHAVNRELGYDLFEPSTQMYALPLDRHYNGSRVSSLRSREKRRSTLVSPSPARRP